MFLLGWVLAVCAALQRWSSWGDAFDFMGDNSFGIYVAGAVGLWLLAFFVRSLGGDSEREEADAKVLEKVASFRAWTYRRSLDKKAVDDWKRNPFVSAISKGMLGRDKVGRRILGQDRFLVSGFWEFETEGGSWELLDLDVGADAESESDRESQGSRTSLTVLEGVLGRFRLRDSFEGKWALINRSVFETGRGFTERDFAKNFDCEPVEGLDGEPAACFWNAKGSSFTLEEKWRRAIFDTMVECSGGEPGARWYLVMDGESLWVGIDLRRNAFRLGYAEDVEKLGTLKRMMDGFERLRQCALN